MRSGGLRFDELKTGAECQSFLHRSLNHIPSHFASDRNCWIASASDIGIGCESSADGDRLIALFPLPDGNEHGDTTFSGVNDPTSQTLGPVVQDDA